MKMVIIFLATLLAVPALAQDAPCPVREDPVALGGICTWGPEVVVGPASRLCDYTQDRIVAEFAVTDPLKDTQYAILVIEAKNSTPGAFTEQIHLQNYIGDGVITADEYYAGTYHSSALAQETARTPIRFDVTGAFNEALLSGESYVGFRFNADDNMYLVYDVYLCIVDTTPTQAVSWGKIRGMVR